MRVRRPASSIKLTSGEQGTRWKHGRRCGRTGRPKGKMDPRGYCMHLRVDDAGGWRWRRNRRLREGEGN